MVALKSNAHFMITVSKCFTYLFVHIKIFFPDGSQHHHVCTSDERLVFPIHQLELLVERILNDINEFHLTFINEVSVVLFLFYFNFFYLTLFYLSNVYLFIF